MKAFVKVWFQEEGGRKIAPKGSPVNGFKCSIIMHGGSGEALSFMFSEKIEMELGKLHFTEISSLLDGMDDYKEVVKDAKFSVVEGTKVVGEGRVMAVSGVEKAL
jgi:hypothetical protein